MNGM